MPAHATVLTRVLVVDDHETVRAGLRAMLSSMPGISLVDDIPDGRDLLDAVVEERVNLVVLDLSMPTNGLTILRRIKARRPDVAVVIFTRHRNSDYLRDALAAGADAYVLKQSPFDTLRAALLAASCGERYVDPALQEFESSARQDGNGRLSNRESEVLRLGASGHANKDIAATLGIAVKTVEVHKSNAMRKLNLRDRSEVLNYAIRQGWLQND